MNFKRIMILLLLVTSMVTMLACSKEPEVQEDPAIIVDFQEEDDVEEISYEGLALNPLTGLWIDEKIAARRPVAVMINNIKMALPQSGISQADVIYETLAEGNITRLVAVFQDFDAEKIGPVRSTRHYYLNIAFDHDAIFVHHGGSPQAFEAIKKLEPANLNSLSYLETIMAWRDPVRSKQKGMYEHSLYTSAEGIMKGWQKVGYREELKQDLLRKFHFAKEEWTPIGETAEVITVPFSKDYISSFRYDEATKLYNRFQFDKPHIDENNQEQLNVKNIIIQYANIRHIAGDTEGRREIELISSGKGLYITNGKAVPITWNKEAYNIPTQYYNMEGKQLEMNPGKTWVCIFPQDKEIEIQ